MTGAGGLRLKIWMVLVAVFALGCVTGAALDGLYRSRANGRGGRGGDERRHEGEQRDQAARGHALRNVREATNLPSAPRSTVEA
jgi:hypothetical protein